MWHSDLRLDRRAAARRGASKADSLRRPNSMGTEDVMYDELLMVQAI